MIFFHTKLGKQIIRSLEVDPSQWVTCITRNSLEHKKNNILIEWHSAKELYKIEIGETRYTTYFTYLDRRAFRKYYEKFLNSSAPRIYNSKDNPEQFV